MLSKSTLIRLGVGATIAGAVVAAYLFQRRPSAIPTLSRNPRVLRAQGCLFGQYIGDALGTRYEFKTQSTVEKQIKQDLGEKNLLPILGGGPFGLKPGQVTDDTELAMALAHSLLNRGTYDQAEISCAYKHWLDSGPFDVGRTTRNALSLRGVDQPQEVRMAMLKQARELNSASLSNGCLMRISPLAIAGTNWSKEALAETAKLDAELTNPQDDAQVAVAAYAVAVAELIRSGDREAAFQAAQEVAQASKLVSSLLRAAKQCKTIVNLADGTIAEHDREHMGYLGIAFQWAFTQMLHAESFEAGLVEVISRGGDTDTNGCICGAMLGARFGLEAIPQEWVDIVRECKQRRVSSYPWVKSSDLYKVAEKLLEAKEPVLRHGHSPEKMASL